ncbi:P-loop containing nucleoside triphosphate hydrolase protein [Gymnopilus junonius]|uniref:P-loop containing nucleoside triphosphate hydrolase protein n=1 Tax=Gymnopilus junonius TaxID=109634 RepID=A0A9P5NKP4_GYMJU|nr:P-loop containing nucleoside triphosphate hydrolase protein [Gymnopilus junonius]
MEQFTPSTRLLFYFISRKHFIFLVVPAVCASAIAGGVAPFMTFVVGQAFDAFATFSTISDPSPTVKNALLHAVGIAALELIGLAVGALALGSITSCLWIWTGETNVMALRKAVYAAVAQKDMTWFDLHLGSGEPVPEGQTNSVGAGGLMAKFSKETDDVRMASSLASGMLVQYLTTCITCLILAFMRSWALTLVILSALPVLVIIQGFSQAFASPLLAQEREQSSIASTIVDRAVAAISTVKAFNASGVEHRRASQVFGHLNDAAKRLNTLWACTSGMSQFVMMAMFVQGFWFGAKLVRDGHASAGDVMTVFWACLIASSNLQMCIPQFIVLAKGKSAMVSLLTVAAPVPSQGVPSSNQLTPSKCFGGFAMYNVTFAYPSRPTVPVLSNVSLFLPANDTTFVVGSSGSGKSTLAHLLLNLYQPQEGMVTLDDTDLRSFHQNWLRSHIACVGQQGAAGVVIFDEKTVFENIAMAVHGHSVTAPTVKEVEEACRAALMHEFVRDLPQGYDTLLGGGTGVGLSGGQKQRLSIARAKLRNPTVLILDEATSALDATSRILVFEAIKRWRKNKTTIVITHDLSQIERKDFVYVLKNGRVVEQGYRSDLELVVPSEKADRGEFRKMMESQLETGGFLPEKHEVMAQKKTVQDLQEEFAQEENEGVENPSTYLKHQSFAFRPLTFGAWMFDVVADLTGPQPVTAKPNDISAPNHPLSYTSDTGDLSDRPRRPSTAYYPSGLTLDLSHPPSSYTAHDRRYSLPPTPTSATFTHVALDDEEEFKKDKTTMERSAVTARQVRGSRAGTRTKWDNSRYEIKSDIGVDKPTSVDIDADVERTPQFWPLMVSVYEALPNKPFLFVGLLICLLNGVMTPIFSFLLSRLLFEVSIGAQDTSTINFFGGLVLAAAAIDGVFLGLKYFIMESCAMSWLTKVRKVALSRILAQDKKWFDKPQHGPARLVQILVKDGDDSRDLIAVVWGQFCVVIAMLGVGLVWAFISSWQLTLAGLAIGPVFAITMSVQSGLVARCESRNKLAREEVAKGYYDTIINIRGIRSMALDNAFKAEFDSSVDESLTTGVRGAFVEGCTYGVANGLIYLAEALLFYVGAILIAKQIYTYLQMIEALNLIVFTVTIGSQLMAFTQKIAKAVQASSDFDKLVKLDTFTEESRGTLRPKIDGTIEFNNVGFTYPERPEAPVLKDINLTISPGECIAIVGASGGGKSTVLSLLQRLYEPTTGSVTIGGIAVSLIDVAHLRNNVSIVSQQPHLFDASIADNIRYGFRSISDIDIRYAAKAANVHDFIMSLPQGYDTHVGENASLLSGGQAQRIQIARSLVRPSRILLLDECTSSLDRENQVAVLDAIRGAKKGRTTIMVTHNLEAMLLCDRILVVQDGQIVEEGSYDALVEQKGVFATLARGGEWVSW